MNNSDLYVILWCWVNGVLQRTTVWSRQGRWRSAGIFIYQPRKKNMKNRGSFRERERWSGIERRRWEKWREFRVYTPFILPGPVRVSWTDPGSEPNRSPIQSPVSLFHLSTPPVHYCAPSPTFIFFIYFSFLITFYSAAS